MAEGLVSDTLSQLSEKIQEHYVAFIMAEDEAVKMENKEKLNLIIRDLLTCAPHRKKFTFPETPLVIRQTILTKENFDIAQTITAWDAIEKYGVNMIKQPWRKEFQTINMYSGYYKHVVSENLVGAELMLLLMGFSQTSDTELVMKGKMDSEKITLVSRDAYIAGVECQILKDIRENLGPYCDMSWLEVLNWRENHTGSAERAIRTLKFRSRQLAFEEQISSDEPEIHEHVHDSPVSSHEDSQSKSPAEVPSPSTTQAEASRPDEEGGADIFLVELIEENPAGTVEQVDVTPLGKANSENPPPSDIQPAKNAQDLNPTDVGVDVNPPEPLPGPSFEPNSSSESDQMTGHVIQLDPSQYQIHKPPKECLEEENATSNDLLKDEKKKSPEGAAASKNKSKDKQSGAVGDVTTAVPRRKPTPVIQEAPLRSKNRPEKDIDWECESYEELSYRRRRRQRLKEIKNDEVSSEWQCLNCTFLNNGDDKICAMCCKTKDLKTDSHTGGFVCRKCTLINDGNNRFCDACGNSLRRPKTCI